MTEKRRYRPPALVLCDRDDLLRRGCHALRSQGYRPLGFSHPDDAESWLDEETPVIAVLDEAQCGATESVVRILHDRGVELLTVRRP